jgi:hypothetical protein
MVVRIRFCPLEETNVGDWSSGMIPALGAGGREFDSRITPFLLPL